MLVVDASAVVDLLLRNEAGTSVEERMRGEMVRSVAHLDAEVFRALARLHRDGLLDEEQLSVRLGMLGEMPVARLPITSSLLDAAWRLRHNVAARDALYVAAAIALESHLLTTDARLARAVPGVAELPTDQTGG